MLQRSPTYVMSVDKGMGMLVAGLYSETSPPTDLADRIAESNPKLVAKLFHKRIIPELAQRESHRLDGIKKAGFKSWLGPEDSGFLMSASGFEPVPISADLQWLLRKLAATTSLPEDQR